MLVVRIESIPDRNDVEKDPPDERLATEALKFGVKALNKAVYLTPTVKMVMSMSQLFFILKDASRGKKDLN